MENRVPMRNVIYTMRPCSKSTTVFATPHHLKSMFVVFKIVLNQTVWENLLGINYCLKKKKTAFKDIDVMVSQRYLG